LLFKEANLVNAILAVALISASIIEFAVIEATPVGLNVTSPVIANA